MTEEEYKAKRQELVEARAEARSQQDEATSRGYQLAEAIARLDADWRYRNNCSARVSDTWGDYRCSRKRGHGPGGRYCKQHAAMPDRWTVEERAGTSKGPDHA